MKTNPGSQIDEQPAYGRSEHSDTYEKLSGGLTKREYFAGLAMQGHISYMSDWNVVGPDQVAKKSVKYADFLIEELNK